MPDESTSPGCHSVMRDPNLVEVLHLSYGPSTTLPLSHKHLLNTLSILFVLSVVHFSLAQMADWMTTDVYGCIFVFLLIFY